MKIAFHSNQLGLRGTEVAMYDYARYNEEILGNESIIISKDPSLSRFSHPLGVKKFEDRFTVYQYEDFSEVEPILDKENVDVMNRKDNRYGGYRQCADWVGDRQRRPGWQGHVE